MVGPTSADGSYSFTDIAAGIHDVGTDAPATYYPDSLMNEAVSLGDSQAVENWLEKGYDFEDVHRLVAEDNYQKHIAQRRRHRRHAPNFKFRLVLEAFKGEKTRAEIAREHDITKSLLYNWEQAFLEHGPEVFAADDAYQQNIAERDERIAELERLVGQLTLENRILKKLETQPGFRRPRISGQSPMRASGAASQHLLLHPSGKRAG